MSWPFRKKSAAGATGSPDLGGGLAPGEYGHYRVLTRPEGGPWELGHGAMGITYKAEDANLRVPVALKVINPLISEAPDARDFFLVEARAAASLRHRNAAAVHHLGVTRTGELFFAMEFIEGETVDALVRRQRRLSVPLALDITQQVACALAAAGQRQIVHRDIKPANLMLNDEGDGTLVVKVIDFGLCKSIRPGQAVASPSVKDGTDHGAPSQFLGTPHYASPEQIRGDAGLDQRSDFYSLGATLWTMLAGRPLFAGPLAQIRARHLSEPPAFEELPGDVSPPVRELLADLLQKDPALRPRTSLELIDRIEGAAYDHRGAEADPRRHWKVQGCVPLLGSVLAHNYHLEAIAGEDHAPHHEVTFRAEDLAGQRPVSVQLLDRDRPLDALRATMQRLAAAPHPNIVHNHAFSSCRGQPFVVNEWTSGFPLSDVLRARGGKFAAAEVESFITQAAAALEHATAYQLGALDTRLSSIQVHFGTPPGEEERRRLLSVPVNAWPEFALKFRMATEAAEGERSPRDAVGTLALLAAELIEGSEGGSTTLPLAHSSTKTPSVGATQFLEGVLPTVRGVIGRALDPSSGDTGYRSAGEFASALAVALRAGSGALSIP